jgi:UTP--glucose-1-phosphate uridylyltransferase
MMRVRKAVIPAAGLGTRFLPATKAIPKEMLPIVDKPTIQYVVEEAVASGLKDIIFVTSQGKNAIEDHFDFSPALDQALRADGKEHLWELVNSLSELISVSSVRQKQPLGLGHAVLMAEKLVGEEPFGVLLGDDIFDQDAPCLRQLVEVHQRHGGSVIAVMEVEPDAVSSYGIVAVDPVEDGGQDRLYRVTDMVEKPPAAASPSNLAIMGRYVLSGGIFKSLRATRPGALGEIQLTDGIRGLLGSEPVYAYRFRGKRYDAGNKLEYLIASIEFGLQHPEVREGLRTYLDRFGEPGQSSSE